MNPNLPVPVLVGEFLDPSALPRAGSRASSVGPGKDYSLVLREGESPARSEAAGRPVAIVPRHAQATAIRLGLAGGEARHQGHEREGVALAIGPHDPALRHLPHGAYGSPGCALCREPAFDPGA